MSFIKSMLIGLSASLIWPGYVLLLAYAARVAPWPRSYARPAFYLLLLVAAARFASDLAKWMFRRDGWLARTFDIPADVVVQLRKIKVALLTAATILLLPEVVLEQGLLAPEGRPISGIALQRLLILAFECAIFLIFLRAVRKSGPLWTWLSKAPESAGFLGNHRFLITGAILSLTALLIFLDARGYGYSSRRIALAAVETTILIGACWVVHRLLLSVVDKNAWRFIRTSQGMTTSTDSRDELMPKGELLPRLRRLVGWSVPIGGVMLGVFFWDEDLAVFRYLGGRSLWKVSAEESVTLGDLGLGALFVVLTVGSWRYLSTIFAVLVYPRLPDDPGVRYAVLTLSRYGVLGCGMLATMSSLHMGVEKIGVVLAALGVGLGFGLQEIVSNFVSGIILLLERPIRVGDTVTVGGLTGKVDRINIRATTLINADNQSLIIPNKEFVTGNLTNWTHKDKIIRVSIPVNVAPGNLPDRISNLLLAIARNDPDVLVNPMPSALLESFGGAALLFVLHVHVPEPSLAGQAKHRIYSEIQKRFAEQGIEIPIPTHELRVTPADAVWAATAGASIGSDRDSTASVGRPRLLAGDASWQSTSSATGTDG